MSELNTMPWSKEYVEHLRTVHFTLVAVATGLIVLVLSAKRYDPVHALAQLEEVLKLKSQWSPAWIQRNGDFEIQNLPDCDSFFRCEYAYSPKYLPEHELIREAALKNRFEGFWADNGMLIRFELPSENWSQTSRPKGVHWSPVSFPNTLAEFRQWWDDLAEIPYDITFPRAIASKRGKILHNDDVIGELIETEKADGDAPKIAARFPLVFIVDESAKNFRYISLDDRNKNEVFGYDLPVTQVMHVVMSQQMVNARFQSMTLGEFDTAFADLGAAALPYQNLQLARLESFLHDDASKGSEVFEALGLKVPADQITLWGLNLPT
jgi:hypothetical protein